MPSLRVALCQIDVIVGDLDANVDLILAAVRQAEEEGCDLAVFGELSICGYPPEDLLFKPKFMEDNRAALARVAAETGDCAVIVGYVDQEVDVKPSGLPGAPAAGPM
ncbi:MAG: NAD+ synthase, partial [Acidimicrobiia bacterium]|nr:NAD+ synthase [Acidimicrobiia bacterium]